eukprot:CAMPEP_0113617058 /NCGR_PEP_ID=MMETSP0017_2-20120614/8571_1 /TAXON_ID=2856 /ORGANISM="Cylindrotheca closterium" /LENGTH=762 /DNA_ID=CAMNT_0000526415 /DNA_START=655 /DNA_END=2943 /DNA_ORIENTATION=+ /assembly_acc=CAM_ASM_000147
MGTATRPSNQHWTTVQSKDKEQHIVENLQALEGGTKEPSTSTEEGMAASPGRLTPMHDSSEYAAPRNVIGTPSTVSTAPSTDDASLMTDYKLDDTVLPHLLQPGHRRNFSGGSFGEEGLLLGGLPFPRSADMNNPWHQALQHGQRPLGGPHRIQQNQQRVASFRNQRPNAAPSGWNQPLHQPFKSDALYEQQNRRRPLEIEVRQPQQYGQQGYVPYHQQQPQGRRGLSPTRQASSHSQRTMTPPRNFRGQRQQGQSSTGPKSTPSSPHQQTSNPQRSNAEVLKTLLRKKACLFEPDTSRAVALITWLVGRELAMEFGFFSRQQLQSGVHACVASKIEGGIITRTRVNRCMQIILNSCFHYIIPRADGTEEKGDYFRNGFASSVKDDSFMLRYLSRLWNDVTVDRETVLNAALNDVEEKPHKAGDYTPKSSPKLSSAEAPKSPPHLGDHDHMESKRAVLLCFNENVRSAEDVFRCHNEFIRDTANAAHLQLTASEWRSFFGREAGHGNYLLGKIGIPMIPQDSASGQDVFGRMAPEEAGKYRTSWCCKRYDHDHSLCGFAHVDVNGGWLRRNPYHFPYKNEMCLHVAKITDPKLGAFFLNKCPHGLQCDKAHSKEEMMYHPNNYKCKVCPSSGNHSCPMGDVCSDFHPQESIRPSKKVTEKHSTPRHGKKGEQPANFKAGHVPPNSAPVVYASPAPFSSFEQQLLMPGLQNLYRRNSSVIRAHLRSKGMPSCSYSCFGDDAGISAEAKENLPSHIGLPSVRRA